VADGEKIMTVDFALTKSPSYRVASIVRVGPWKEDNLRSEFEELERWAKRQGVRTGSYIFMERGTRRWEACLEYRGRAEAEGRIRLKTLPATAVARVIFDPDQVSSRIVYHGLSDWTRWRKKYGEIRSVVGPREVYSGNPWKDEQAWAHCEVQFVVRK
jgi:effector-binding domain-containing protein